jgi:hypothetical protein
MTYVDQPYWKLKEYFVPDSLDELKGPRTGKVNLPIDIYWGPFPEIDLADDAQAARAYRAIINQGTISQIRTLLNPNRLLQLWPKLTLPRKVIDSWQNQFPTLAEIRNAA